MDSSVNVLQFAEARSREIGSLLEEFSSNKRNKSVFQQLPNHMRRRSASHNPRRVPKALRALVQTTPAKKSKARKIHHRRELQGEYASRSFTGNTWLENHMWFAKRFKMDVKWGWRLPMHSNDRKLGHSHRSAVNHAMLQDMSYYPCIELEGPQEKLLTELALIVDKSSDSTFSSEMFLDGSKEGHAIIYHPKFCPFKAIGPVSFMWKPVFCVAGDETRQYLTEIPSDTHRKLWIFCHPSCYEEIVEVIQTVFCLKEEAPSEENVQPNLVRKSYACDSNWARTKGYLNNEKMFSNGTVKMILLRNRLVRHRLIGPMSQAILGRVLRIATVDKEASPIEPTNILDFESGWLLKLPQIAKLISDSKPVWWESYYNTESLKELHNRQSHLLECLRDSQSSSYVEPRSIIGLTVRDPRSFPTWEKEKKSDTGEDFEERFELYKDLGQHFTPEVADSAIWDRDIRTEVTLSKTSDEDINEERAMCIVAPGLGKRENRIPILIVHQNGINGFGYGWDLIAPMGWCGEFWMHLIRSGGRPAGLEDLHFINLEFGCPSFPCSFPDTAAGAAYEEKLRADNQEKYSKRPPSKRPKFTDLGITTPFSMSWKSIVSDWAEERSYKELSDLITSLGGKFPPENETGNAVVLFKSQPVDFDKEFYVFRHPDIVGLYNFCKRMSRMPKSGLSSGRRSELQECFNTTVMSLTRHKHFIRSLCLIKLRCVNKGRPSTYAGIYFLNGQDMEEMKSNNQLSGPSSGAKKISRNSDRECKGPKSSSLDSDDHKLIGYISEGCFSSVCGQGFAIGHCSSVAFLLMLKQCLEANLKPLVLIKEQHSPVYRLSDVEIIDHYL